VTSLTTLTVFLLFSTTGICVSTHDTQRRLRGGGRSYQVGFQQQQQQQQQRVLGGRVCSYGVSDG